MKNKKGFTLIELLAVIVILGVIMAIAIPAMTEYIDNSKKDSMVSSAVQYLDAAINKITTDNQLPVLGESSCILVKDLEIQKGGVSPYTNASYSDNSIVKIARNANGYEYSIYLKDESGNCLNATEPKLNATAKKKRELIKTGNSCAVIEKTSCNTIVE